MQLSALETRLNATPLTGLTIYPCEQGYQANLQTELGWRVRIAATPAEALSEVLRVEAPIAPPPY